MLARSNKRISYRDNPECPCGDFPWEGYYWRRPFSRTTFESDYWGTVTDPDGRSRNLLEERLQKIEDQKQEIGFINQLNPGKVLDIGCGPGFTLSGIHDVWEKYGTEVSRVAALHAKQYGKIFQGEVFDAGYVSNFFDAVLMIHVLRYVNDPLKVVREIKRVLKPEGHLVIADADYDSGCARRFKENYRLLHDKGVINLFTSVSLVSLLENTGFEIVRVEYPFFETQWFTKDNLLRLFDTEKVSPPFYGNFVTILSCRR
jgi:SAM-dependent methyltransferase